MKVINRLFLFAVICTFAALPLRAQTPQKQELTPGATAQPVSAPAGDGVASSTLTVRREYRLGPNDVVELRVFGEPQFDGSFTVDSDGNITIPFVEEPVAAQCRSVKEISKEVTGALAKFLKNPRIYMTVKEEKSRTPATVYGAVRSPAQYEMRRPARLLELLSKSGGVTEQQSGTIQIFHTQPLLCPEPEEMKVAAQVESGTDTVGVPFTVYRVEDLKLGKNEANPYIHPGDVIYVAEAAPIYITGNVVQPSNLYLRENMTLTRALAIVGGPKDAKEDKVKIYRQKPGAMKQEVVMVDYKAIKQGKKEDIALQPYDVVEVPAQGKFGLKSLPTTLLNMAMGAGSSLATQAPLRILY
ncbi:MAG TPA: SLBB domain-containing protein [Pyrinomonadaceae bacterium]|nr:SLBB domain-containing protein [Pyrinomonadaceae bacterium]